MVSVGMKLSRWSRVGVFSERLWIGSPRRDASALPWIRISLAPRTGHGEKRVVGGDSGNRTRCERAKRATIAASTTARDTSVYRGCHREQISYMRSTLRLDSKAKGSFNFWQSKRKGSRWLLRSVARGRQVLHP